MNIYKTAVNNPITTILVFIAISIFGIFSLMKLPIDFFPHIETTNIMVITAYPGASAIDIEENVTRPLENTLNRARIGPYVGLSINPLDPGLQRADWDEDFSKGVFRCPIWKSALITSGLIGEKNIYGGGYGYGYYGDKYATGYQYAGRVIFWRKVTQVGKPSETIIIGESSDGDLKQESAGAVLYYGGCTTVPGDPDRHDKAFNALWVDGHVSLMKTLDYTRGKPSSISAANGQYYYVYAGEK